MKFVDIAEVGFIMARSADVEVFDLFVKGIDLCVIL